MSGDLLALIQSGDSRPVRAIVRGDVQVIRLAAARAGLPVVKELEGMVVVEGDPATLDLLRQVPGILGISLDALVVPAMTVSDKAMAADQTRAGSSGLLGVGSLPPVKGRGIGVAVVDSGISAHAALSGKVVASVNFATGTRNANDEYGHGTHIAGIIAGASLSSSPTPLYKGGIAPGAHLINVRVLGPRGAGYTSDVIAGIQWVMANQSRYRIRVMNLSLGHPIVEPCVTDPLCLEAERAVVSGLVVVASAGNTGRDAEGRTVLGSVSTPGNAPGVITVGALNTWNTVARTDDTVTTYSSRGPTRYDMFVKPDVVAPGNKIVSLEAAGSYLTRTYPTLHVAGRSTNAYRLMSGTSMAAGMVSGGAALLLESAPTLTVRHVKVALQLTASPMPGEGLMAAGTGSVNLLAARQLSGVAGSLVTVLPTTTVGGRRVTASGLVYLNGGAVLDQTVAYAGLRVLRLLDLRNALQTTLLGSLGSSAASQIIWGDQSLAGQQIIWGDQTTGGQQIIWGDQVFNPAGQQIIWGDQVYDPGGQQIIWGDSTSSDGQQIIWGDSSSQSDGAP